MDALKAILNTIEMLKKCECTKTQKILTSSIEELTRISIKEYHKLEVRLEALEEKNLKIVKMGKDQMTFDISSEVEDGDL